MFRRIMRHTDNFCLKGDEEWTKMQGIVNKGKEASANEKLADASFACRQKSQTVNDLVLSKNNFHQFFCYT
ncbi:hypothetical protein IGI46_000527 [Enterococcus sp. AZ163]